MSGGYVQFESLTQIHNVFLVAMFRFESYWHGSTVYVWWPWPVLLDMDLCMSAFMLWVIYILIMGIPTLVMIYYCTVFTCLLAGFRPIVPCSLHTLDKVFHLSLCSSFILWRGSLLRIIFLISMIVNDVNLFVVFRRVSGLSSWRKKGEELFLRKEVTFSFGKTL